MERRIEFPSSRQVAAADSRQKLSRRLCKTFVPAALLYPQLAKLCPHFAVEQPTRCWAGQFLPFNGTGGICGSL